MRGDVINDYKYLKSGRQMDGARLILVVLSDRTMGSGHEVEHRNLPFHWKLFCTAQLGDGSLAQVPRGAVESPPWRSSEAEWM